MQESVSHVRHLDEDERDVLIGVSSSIESADKTDRIEQPWDHRAQSLLTKWGQQATKQAKLHGQRAHRNKIMFFGTGLPAALIPAVLGVARAYIPDGPTTIIMLMLCSILSTVAVFFDFGGLRNKHYKSEFAYIRFKVEVDSVLSKPKRFRRACDVSMEKMKMIFIQIGAEAPVV